jgi:methionyl-tRNA formyltransferase
MTLAGLIIIRDSGRARWRAARREIRRVGWLKFLDVVAFRVYARAAFASRDNAWKTVQLERLRDRYHADIAAVPRIVVATPNAREAREFLERLRPDLMIARCKYILKPEIFELPRAGTFVMHPGICPEYRNAHGCFWALANRDLGRVGMTLLKVDRGIDTGPIYLHAGCEIDEVHDSHIVIQYRAVLDNLDAIARVLVRIARGEAVTPLDTSGRLSAAWGQPRLTNYLRWKSTARKQRRHETRIAAVS